MQERAELAAEQPFVIRSRFTDFDEFAESVRAWNLEFRLLDCGRFDADVLQFGSDEAQLARARFNRHLHQKGDPPPGMRTVVIPADESQDFLWRGQRITGRTLMVFPDRAELESFSQPGFDIYTLSLHNNLVEVVAESLEIPSLDGLMRGAETVELPRPTMRELRHGAREVCMRVRTEPRWLSRSGLQARLRLDLPRQVLLSIAAHLDLEEKAPAHQKGRALRRALDYLARRPAEVASVAELCRHAGVSERTLRRAFLEEFGVPPKTYLMTIRMRAVRAELQANRPEEVKIGDIANHWGFWHMGQFAADYRRHFGELPSQTLRRSDRSRY